MAKKISSKDLFEKEDIFEGIRLSAKQTIEQLGMLDAEFKQFAQSVKTNIGGASTSSTQGINKLMGATNQANDVMEESIRISKLKAQAEQQLQKAEQEAAKAEQQKSKAALEALRVQQQQAKESERVAKASERAARMAANEGNAYKQLEKQARDLKNESKRLGAEMLALDQAGQRNSQEYRELAMQYEQTTMEAQQMDKQLKSLDYTVGDHQRNVGNYTSATGNLKKELRALTMELMNMDEADPRFQEMAARAGQLKDQIQDTQAVIKATAGSAIENFGGAFARAGEIAARAVQGVVAGMQLLGVEDPDTLKNIQRLQAIGSLADSLKGLGGLKDALTEIRSGLTAAAVKSGLLVQVKQADVVATAEQTAATTAQTGAIVANTTAQEANIVAGASGNAVDEAGLLLTEANTLATAEGTVATVADTIADEASAVAQVASTAATEGATAATYAFNTALLANPVVLVTAGVVALGAALWYVFGREKELTAAEKERAQAQKESADRAKKLREEEEALNKTMIQERGSFMFMIEALKKTNAGSKERSLLITEINNKYGTTLKNMGSELAFQKQLNVAAAEWLKTQEAKYKLQANEKKFVALMEEEQKLQERTDKLRKAQQGRKGPQFEVTQVGVTGVQRASKESAAKKKQQELAAANDRELKQGEDRLKQIQKEKEALATVAAGESVLALSNQKVTSTNTSVSKSTSEVTTTFEELNVELSRAVELMQTLAEQRQTQEIRAQQEAIDYALTEEIKRIEAGGDAQVDALEKIVVDRFEMEKQFAKERLLYDLEQIKLNYEAQKAARQKALDDEKKELEDAAKKELKGAKGLQAKLDEINANYQVRQSELNKQEATLYGDMVLERMVKEGEYSEQVIQITEAQGDEINRINDAVFEAQIKRAESLKDKQEDVSKKEIESLKRTEEEKRAIIKATADFFEQNSKKRVQQLDEEIKAAEKQYDVLQGLAQQGNINAQQSLAEQQRIIDEANMKKEREQKRQQRIRLAESVYSTYSQKVEAGSKNPLAETIRDTTLLQQFIASLPTFLDGTEDTGMNGRGIDGKGGFHAVLHPNERVIPKDLNEQIGSLSNVQLAKVAQEYQNGRLMEGARQSASALEFALLVNEVKDLKQVIKDKPETNIGIGEITQSLVEVVEKRVRGNSVTYNRFKVRK
jgi:hypothetical protein